MKAPLVSHACPDVFLFMLIEWWIINIYHVYTQYRFCLHYFNFRFLQINFPLGATFKPVQNW